MKRRTISAPLIAVVVAAGLLAIGTGQAKAANISRVTTFTCDVSSVTVYFPQLYPSNGQETVYYSPDLWRYTNDGWAPYDTTKPWYYTFVGLGGAWYVHPTGAPTMRNTTPFWNLPSGWYAVKGHFYQGYSHWGTAWQGSQLTNSTMCYVS